METKVVQQKVNAFQLILRTERIIYIRFIIVRLQSLPYLGSKFQVVTIVTAIRNTEKFLHFKPTSSTCDFGVVLDIDGVLIRE
uniref:AlNc14C143G7320 protein n=1 Tax=Albugo laibachii Nc14 TaxID=890382 RepID=F0WLD2_9STRA|nr:AlNc14C143G7320 [Albugo laibachii Nc14]|eukprot:CCA22095.1 AlNc14C143G7320 [Albugo laibachii Nc14]